MKCTYSCHSPEHTLARRRFLAGMAAAAAGVTVGGLDFFGRPAAAAQLKKDQKRVVLFNMHGGLSQLESWDPKPGTDTGGPFRAISTSVPGISDLRASAQCRQADAPPLPGARGQHRRGRPRQGRLLDGHRAQADARRRIPQRRCRLRQGDGPTRRCAAGPHRDHARWRRRPRQRLRLPGPQVLEHSCWATASRPSTPRGPATVSEPMDAARNEFRRRVNERFLNRRRTAVTEAYTYSYEQALQLMARKEVFDVSKEPAKDHDRYGKYDLGRHCLLARRLLEKGATFVQVSHSNYDTHNENFNFHIEQLGEFDQSFAAFVADLADRGMLDSTLIVVLSEFGRTPNDQPLLRPRSLVARLDGGGGRRQDSPRDGLRQDQRQGHGGRRRPGRSRQPVPHLSSRPWASIRPTRSRSKDATSRSPTRRRR